MNSHEPRRTVGGHPWPGWLIAIAAPVVAAAALLAGRAERTLFAAAFRYTERAALNGNPVAGGRVVLALLLPAFDVVAVGAALAALQRGLARRRHHDARFPWTSLVALAAANALCIGCSVALGTVTAWGSLLGMILWLVQMGE